MDKVSIGVVIGHRDVFPGSLAEIGRKKVLTALGRLGLRPLIMGEEETRYGAISCLEDAKKYARFFREHSGEIIGFLISLPDFGDESSIAALIRLTDLRLPVFVHAFPDDLERCDIQNRNDSFCGKFSLCNNLRQAGIPFSVGAKHVLDPEGEEFADEVSWFLGVCRVVNGLRNARIGSIGARTPDFRTMRFSEKILERNGISVETVDLSYILSIAEELRVSDPDVSKRISVLDAYCVNQEGVPKEVIAKNAKLSLVIERWLTEREVSAYALQCWPALQKSYGIYPCTFMSFLSDRLIPSACETDVMGALSMYALQLASGTPSALFDINNNYGNDPEKMILFHCGNCPTSFMDRVRTSFNAMAVKGDGLEHSFAVFRGILKPGWITFARVMTDDTEGMIRSYLAEAEVVSDSVETFGSTGVVRMRNLPVFLRYLCEQGFEHHTAISRSSSAAVLHEAFSKYLGWNVYLHDGESS